MSFTLKNPVVRQDSLESTVDRSNIIGYPDNLCALPFLYGSGVSTVVILPDDLIAVGVWDDANVWYDVSVWVD